MYIHNYISQILFRFLENSYNGTVSKKKNKTSICFHNKAAFFNVINNY